LDFRSIVVFFSEWLGAVATAWLLSISPRFKKPPIGFVYARRDGIMALSLASVIILFAFVYYGSNPPSFPPTVPLAPGPVHALGQALFVSGVALLPFLIALVLRKQPVRSLGWNRALLAPGIQVGIAIAILTIFLRNRFQLVLTGEAFTQLTPLLLALGVAVAEETAFRGYIQLRLTWWMGPVPGILLTSALFTLWHAAAWWNRLPNDTILTLAVLTFLQSLVLGWVMRKAPHAAAPAIYRAFSIWMQYLG
jgi:membrane protease YdiL (CAAX protease family)